MRLTSTLLIGLAATAISACGPDVARVATRQEALDPIRLWQAQAVTGSGAIVRTMQVCADRRLREGFRRAEPQVNDQTCRTAGPVVSKPGLYALKCEVGGHRFGVTVTSRGDPDRDFQVSYALRPLDLDRGPFIQTVRYRLIGRCPPGWRIGDQAEVDRPDPNGPSDSEGFVAGVTRPYGQLRAPS